LIILNARLDRPRGARAVLAQHFHDLVATLAPNSPVGYDQHVILLVDGDGG
jgi:hypothetical protein